MNAKARQIRNTVRTREAARRSARKAHTMASHAITAGLDANTASGIGGALRAKAKQQGSDCRRVLVTRTAKGKLPKGSHKRVAYRYHRTQVLTALHAYNPRAARFVVAKATMLAHLSA